MYYNVLFKIELKIKEVYLRVRLSFLSYHNFQIIQNKQYFEYRINQEY
jgi:hypothetical protein